MKKMKIIIVAILLTFVSISSLNADIADDLEKIAEDNAKKYLEPFAISFCNNLNTGWYYTAETRFMNIGFSLNSAFAYIPDDDKTFMATSPNDTLFQEPEVKTATVFGDEGGVFHYVTDSSEFKLPDGINTNVAPIVYPQFRFGLMSGFEVQARFLPTIKVSEDIGNLNFFGIGVKNEISKSLGLLIPLAISVQGTYQHLKLGDIVSMNSTTFNVHASRDLIAVPVTLFGGVGYECSKLSADYTYHADYDGEENTKIDFDITNDNMNLTLGVKLKIMVLNIVTDYTISKYNVLHLGLAASF